jgi:hypothetical protein
LLEAVSRIQIFGKIEKLDYYSVELISSLDGRVILDELESKSVEKKSLRSLSGPVLDFGFEILDFDRYKLTRSSNISFYGKFGS